MIKTSFLSLWIFKRKFSYTSSCWLGSACCEATGPASQGSAAVPDLARLCRMPQQAREGSEPAAPTLASCSQESLETALGGSKRGHESCQSIGRSQLEKRVDSYLLPAPSLLCNSSCFS